MFMYVLIISDTFSSVVPITTEKPRNTQKTSTENCPNSLTKCPTPSSDISTVTIVLIVVGCIVMVALLMVVEGVTFYRMGKKVGSRRSRPAARDSMATEKVSGKWWCRKRGLYAHPGLEPEVF